MIIGLAAAAVLVVLPGAWISFGLRLPGLGAGTRLAVGCALSPFVLLAQYYALRWCGLSWDGSFAFLVGGNLPALALVARRARPVHAPTAGELALGAALLSIPLACLIVPALLQPGEVPWWLHTFMHSDTTYALAAGQLHPEESRLAGLRQAYPWSAHVFQALIARALDRPPIAIYPALNLVPLLVTTFLVGGFTRALGGGVRARALSWVALWFGINALGFALRVWILPRGWEQQHLFHAQVLGDVRYTPWLWKFRFLEHVVYGLALFAALPHFMLRLWRPDAEVAGELTMLTALLLAIVFVYPVLAAAAFGMVGACAVAMLCVRAWEGVEVPRARGLQLGAVLFACGLVGYVFLQVLVVDRYRGTGGLNGPFQIARKSVQSLVVAGPLLALAALRLRARWSDRPRAETILALGVLVSFALYVALMLPSPRNEYKYVFSAGVCLAPFAGVVLEPLLARTGRAWPLWTLAACALLAVPHAIKARTAWLREPQAKPALDLSTFTLRLAPGEPGARVYDAIRERSPAEAVLAVDAPAFDLTPLTWRPLWAPEAQNSGPGMNIDIEHLLVGVRGYDPALVATRKAACRSLFSGADAERAAALEAMLELGRPVVVVLDLAEHAALFTWLEGAGRGRLLERDGRVAAWLVGVD